MAAPSHGSGLMQTRDEAERLGEQPSGHRLDHGRSALTIWHTAGARHRRRSRVRTAQGPACGEAALGPGVAARTERLDLGGDLTFDGLEDDIDLDALLVCGARGPGQVVSDPVTALVCVVVTVRRLSERAWRAFGPRLRDPDLPSVWVGRRRCVA